MAPEALNALTPEERRQVYGMLRTWVVVRMDGTLEVSGTFGGGSGFCQAEARCSTRFEPAQQLGLRFHTVLSDGTQEVRFERVAASSQ